MKKFLLYLAFITFGFICKAQTVSDIEGNVYNTVTIGTQVWLKENLKTTKYNDSTSIPLVTDFTSWINLTTPAYCNYDNTNNADTINTYGRLYNWYTVNTGKLCPTGWHVPTNDEWTTLTDYLGGESISGGKLKETDTMHWTAPNTGATDEVGFTALPGGGNIVGPICSMGDCGSWWSTSENFPGNAISVSMNYDNSLFSRAGTYEIDGFSVRCVKINNVNNVSSLISNDLSIYPNPATDILYIRNYNNANVFISIHDLTGKQVFYTSIHSKIIDISNLKNGVYIFKLIDSGHVTTNKFIKE